MDTISLYNWILAGHLTFSLPPPARRASSQLFQQGFMKRTLQLLFTNTSFSSGWKKKQRHMCDFAPLDKKPTLQPLSMHTGGSRAPFDCFLFTVNINQTLGHSRALEAVISFAPRDDAIRAVERSVFMRISCFPSSLEKCLFKKNKRNKNRLFTFSHKVEGSSRESELRYVAHHLLQL